MFDFVTIWHMILIQYFVWCKQVENYQPTNAPLDGETVYKATYPGHTQFPQISQARPPSHKDYRERSAKFDQRTTNKEEYRAWVAKPSVAFGELPSFAGRKLIFLRLEAMWHTNLDKKRIKYINKMSIGNQNWYVKKGWGNILLKWLYTWVDRSIEFFLRFKQSKRFYLWLVSAISCHTILNWYATNQS